MTLQVFLSLFLFFVVVFFLFFQEQACGFGELSLAI